MEIIHPVYLNISILRDNKINKVKSTVKEIVNNQNLLEQLSEKTQLTVISLVYHPNEELEEKDVSILIQAINCIDSDSLCLILHGPNGGHFSPALDLAAFLRNKFNKKLVTVVPKVAASAKCYIALLSNKLYMSESSYLTQFDIVFSKDNGKTYRAHEALTDQDPTVKDDARFIWNMSFEILKKILMQKGSLVKKRPFSDLDIERVMNVCMRKKDKGHNSHIRLQELKKLNLNVFLIDKDDEPIFQSIVENALERLIETKKKFVLESSKNIIYY